MAVTVFLDIRRAFYVVSHAHVFHGLLKLCVQERMLRWLSEFLQGRTIFVHTTDRKSHEHTPFHGVPQGSVLSPTMFNAIMAQLPVQFPSNVRNSLYANSILYGPLVHSFPSLISS